MIKILIGVGLFGAGVFTGVQLAKWYAQKEITEKGDAFIGKVFGSGYVGQVARQVYDGGVDRIIN